MLGGRAWQRHLYPLTYVELKEKFDLERALKFGTLPSVYLSDDESASETLDSYFDIYIAEEVKAEALVRNIGAFISFLKLAGAESGEIVNFSNISQEINVSSNTIKEYYQILEDTLLGNFLLAYSSSQRKKLTKSPKFYFFDTGVKHAIQVLLGVKLESGTKLYGNAFEHFVINQIIAINSYSKSKYDLSYYRTAAGAEVDLIVKTPQGKTFAIEIKSSENPRDFLPGLKSFKELEPNAELLCFSTAPYYRLEKEVKIFPWQEGIEYIFS
jgi:predicted AAA+ superfamily ATPase